MKIHIAVIDDREEDREQLINGIQTYFFKEGEADTCHKEFSEC